jgi:hypothetical protein
MCREGCFQCKAQRSWRYPPLYCKRNDPLATMAPPSREIAASECFVPDPSHGRSNRQRIHCAHEHVGQYCCLAGGAIQKDTHRMACQSPRQPPRRICGALRERNRRGLSRGPLFNRRGDLVPGIKNWRRSLTVQWQAHFGRISWDLHSALGFWLFPFVLVWGLSAVYFAFPAVANPVLKFDPSGRYTDLLFYRLSELHFGRLGWVIKVLWSIVGLVPALLAFTGVFICCRRMIYKKPSNPNVNH